MTTCHSIDTLMEGGSLHAHVSRLLVVLVILASAWPTAADAQEAVLDILPLRPFSFDVSFNDRSFAPTRRVFALQAGITALRYGPLELRGIYQYYSHYTPAFGTDQHSLYVNPRWNNFIDLLDVLEGKPISRFLRHALFGPLENRAVPYLGAMLGGNLSGADFSPGYLYGGQIGVRFPVAQGFSVDMGLQYTRFQVDFEGDFGVSRQWLYTIGVRF